MAACSPIVFAVVVSLLVASCTAARLPSSRAVVREDEGERARITRIVERARRQQSTKAADTKAAAAGYKHTEPLIGACGRCDCLGVEGGIHLEGGAGPSSRRSQPPPATALACITPSSAAHLASRSVAMTITSTTPTPNQPPQASSRSRAPTAPAGAMWEPATSSGSSRRAAASCPSGGQPFCCDTPSNGCSVPPPLSRPPTNI
jgi:hypothetical protein